jgi:hypothetical protein
MGTKTVLPVTTQDTRNPTALPSTSINGGRPVVVRTQAELDLILESVRLGKPLRFRTEPGRSR